MANELSKPIRSLRKSIGQGIQKLINDANAVEKPGSSSTTGTGQVKTNEPHLTTANQPAVQIPAFRLHVLEKGIWAICSSCGTMHPLEAVCFACGKPLCNDTHCREVKYHPQLKQKVVVCNECKNTF